MAPKRAAAAAAKAESSGSSYTQSSSEENDGPQKDAEVVRLSSPSAKKKSPQKQPAEPAKPAKPAAKPSPNPPAASEDEDDSEEDDKSGSGSGSGNEDGSSDEASESEDEKGTTRPSPITPQPKPKLPQPSPKLTPAPPLVTGSDSGSSDGSDSGSDSSEESPASTPASRPSRAAGLSIKPISTRPMDASPKSVKSAPTPPPHPSLERGSGRRKREAMEPSELDSNQGGQKRQLFQRLWSLDDEIALLNGLVEYRNKKNTVPGSAREMDDFRDLIKSTVQAEATITQLSDKVRRLKKKFETNAARAKKGAALTFSNPHEQKAYEVSMKVWGSNKSVSESDDHSDDSDDAEESKKTTKNNKKSNEHLDDLIALNPNNTIKDVGRDIVKDKSRYPYLCETVSKMAGEYLCSVAIKRALEMLDDAKARQMEEKLKRLGTTETKQHLRTVDLHKETVKLILESLSRSERSEHEQ